MKSIVVIVGLLVCNVVTAQQKYTLSPPISSHKRIVLQDKAKIGFAFRMEGAEIRYTIDNPNLSVKSETYVDSIVINKPCTIRAASFHPDFQMSEPVVVEILRLGKNFASVSGTASHEKYPGNGLNTLHDRKLGSLDFRSEYLGFNIGSIELKASLDKKKKINQVVISTLTNQGAWIFGPAEIMITDDRGRIIGQQKIIESTQVMDPKLISYAIPCDRKKHKNLTILIKPLNAIPDWHDGKGSLPWTFIDEVYFE